jgi:predicted transcriptional regulator YdeE
MKYDELREQGLTIMGIATRASNANPNAIGELWNRFHTSGIRELFPARLNNDIYSVYFDYERDFTAPYTVLIGYAVPFGTPIPEDLQSATVPSGSYVVFDASGEQPASLIEAWSTVWTTPLDRKYDADFELHREDGTVAIYVGVR